MKTTDTTRRRAPLSSYLKAAGLASACAAVVGGSASLFYNENRLLAFVIFAACTAGTFFGLGWVLFVSEYTAEEDPHTEDNVERRWYERATSGAFGDVITTGGIGLFLMSVTRIQVSGVTVITLLLILAMISAFVRYRVARWRDS